MLRALGGDDPFLELARPQNTQSREAAMIVTRRVGETIRIGADITLTILRAEPRKQAAWLGIDAPRHVPVDRAEVRARKDRGEPPPNERGGK